jgi:hypothetical protein
VARQEERARRVVVVSQIETEGVHAACGCTSWSFAPIIFSKRSFCADVSSSLSELPTSCLSCGLIWIPLSRNSSEGDMRLCIAWNREKHSVEAEEVVGMDWCGQYSAKILYSPTQLHLIPISCHFEKNRFNVLTTPKKRVRETIFSSIVG